MTKHQTTYIGLQRLEDRLTGLTLELAGAALVDELRHRLLRGDNRLVDGVQRVRGRNCVADTNRRARLEHPTRGRRRHIIQEEC